MSAPPPLPGRCETVRSRSALVLAPHYDDEVLGCGGLLCQLAAAGAAVRILFLTDGGAGPGGEAGDPEGYRRRRREEAQRVAEILGIAGADHLGRPDGALDQYLDETAEAIRGALLTQRPDLLLVPSPLEVSPDHRAAFAAVGRILEPLRGGTELDAAAAALDILLYEVNGPGHPDLLVDVSAQVPALERAMSLYASQEERHPYWRASLGLRRFRTLSLPPEVEAAEGYRRLAAADFASRGPARLLRELGAVPEVAEVREGPRISVVVRTKDRPGLLAEALASLAATRYRRAEVVLVNDGGEAPEVAPDYPLPVVRVDLAENRGRAGAANAGIAAASGDAVTFLDDDDLAEPEHLATLARLISAPGVRVAYSDAAVAVYELDAAGGWVEVERHLPYSRKFDPELLLFDNYIPFNTLIFERRLLQEAGPLEEELPFFEDWDLLIRLAERVPFHHLARVTCEYRLFRGSGHHALGAAARERGDYLATKARVLAKHAGRHSPEILARVVDRLRAEAEERRGEVGLVQRQVEALRRETEALQERLVPLERLRIEHERVTAEAAALRRVVEDQTGHLGRTYAEIERLNGVIREMEGTRAWRLHEWWHGKKGR